MTFTMMGLKGSGNVIDALLSMFQRGGVDGNMKGKETAQNHT